MPSIPDRWMNYKPFGTVIKDTKILAFKVPLKPTVVKALLPEQQFTTGLLMQAFPKLKFVIDLTNTTRYYSKQDFIDAGVGYQKILVEGKKVPNMGCTKQFFKTMDDFFASAKDDELIGVHCTHGLNRTGYLICRYLVQQFGWNLENAIAEFGKARGHEIERKEYIEALKSSQLNTKLDTSNVVPNREPSTNSTNGRNNNSRNRKNRRQMSRRDDYKSSKPPTRFDYDNLRNRNYDRQRDYYPVGPSPSRVPMPRFPPDHNNYNYHHNQHHQNNRGYGPMPGPYLPPPLLRPPPPPLPPQQFDDIPHVGPPLPGPLPPGPLPPVGPLPPNNPSSFSDRRFDYQRIFYPFMDEPKRPEFPPRNRPTRNPAGYSDARNNHRTRNHHPRKNELNNKKINNEQKSCNEINPIVVNAPPPPANFQQNKFDNDVVGNNFCEVDNSY